MDQPIINKHLWANTYNINNVVKHQYLHAHTYAFFHHYLMFFPKNLSLSMHQIFVYCYVYVVAYCLTLYNKKYFISAAIKFWIYLSYFCEIKHFMCSNYIISVNIFQINPYLSYCIWLLKVRNRNVYFLF